MDDKDLNILFEWWNDLKNDRGGRAELRRARCPEEVVFFRAYHRLYSHLHWDQRDRDKIAVIAGLAAHVQHHNGGHTVAEQMAFPKSGADPVISSLRFRRILAIQNRDELYMPLLRIIRALDGNVNLLDLAKSVYWWNKKTKKDWAYSYWGKVPKEK